MKTRPIGSLEQLFRALSDDTRRRILALVASGDVCVCHIHEALGVPQPTVSRHLAYLRRAGLVSGRRDGLWVHYRLEAPADPTLAAVLRTTLDALGGSPGVAADRKRLSEVTAVPFRAIVRAAAACCR
jgi:ArsR family transcriptional regulator, arsenate/arsenite/antimonite-responsive transcriptional repressor